MSRVAKLIIILGYNGTGKTTLVRQFAERSIKRKEKVLIVTRHMEEWTDIPETNLSSEKDFEFAGMKRYIYRDHSVLKKIFTLFNKGLIVFDDCRSYFNFDTHPELENMYISRRQMESDIIMTGHGFTRFPLGVFTYYSECILFLTKDNIKKRKDDIAEFDLIHEAQQRVNNRAMDKEKAWVDPKDISQNMHYFEVVKN